MCYKNINAYFMHKIYSTSSAKFKLNSIEIAFSSVLK